MTPAQAWEATPVAAPPDPPAPHRPVPGQQAGQWYEPPTYQDHLQQSLQVGDAKVDESGDATAVVRTPARRIEDSGYTTRHATARGYVSFRGVKFLMGSRYRGKEVRVAWDPDFIVFADMDGVVIVVHEHPPAGTDYVSNGVPQGRPRKTGKSRDSGEVSPKS